jgi:hypothetical protein
MKSKSHMMSILAGAFASMPHLIDELPQVGQRKPGREKYQSAERLTKAEAKRAKRAAKRLRVKQ